MHKSCQPTEQIACI